MFYSPNLNVSDNNLTMYSDTLTHWYLHEGHITHSLSGLLELNRGADVDAGALLQKAVSEEEG